MNEDPIIYLATLNKAGSIDIQCRPSALTMEGYGAVLASAVSATVNMFVEAGVPHKEALDTILKTLTREARNPSNSVTFGSTRLN